MDIAYVPKAFRLPQHRQLLLDYVSKYSTMTLADRLFHEKDIFIYSTNEKYMNY